MGQRSGTSVETFQAEKLGEVGVKEAEQSMGQWVGPWEGREGSRGKAIRAENLPEGTTQTEPQIK